jgi:hypothetical protein
MPCRALSLEQLIKLIMVYELHGLNDIAVDTVERFANRLKGRLDIEHAMRLLADPPLPAGVRCGGSCGMHGAPCGGGCVLCKERRNRPKFSPAELSSRLILDRETGAAGGGQAAMPLTRAFAERVGRSPGTQIRTSCG